jgi:hypothetical protein
VGTDGLFSAADTTLKYKRDSLASAVTSGQSSPAAAWEVSAVAVAGGL